MLAVIGQNKEACLTGARKSGNFILDSMGAVQLTKTEEIPIPGEPAQHDSHRRTYVWFDLASDENTLLSLYRLFRHWLLAHKRESHE